MMDDKERQRRIARLAYLGIPQAFHAAIVERAPPRGHTLMHAAIILTSIGLAILALVGWSRYVAIVAENAAEAAGAQLFGSDLGLESLGGLLTVLFAAGWLCGWLTRRRGSEAARNGTAYDLIHEPAKNKAITDWAWRWMIARQLPTARDADDFLDRLAGGMVRYLRRAALGSLAVTIILFWFVPAHYYWATDNAIEDHRLLLWSQTSSRSLMSAITVTSGCPVLPRDGSTLIYSIHFSDGTDADLGSWQPVRGDRLDALEKIAAHVPPTATHEYFSNAIGSPPLDADCLRQFAGPPGTERAIRLLKLLNATAAEKALLRGQL
jgi:hypothetical protein